MNKNFEITILRLHWIKDDGQDDPEDKCVHGEVLVRIGDEVLSNAEAGSWSLGTFALFLMRSLKRDYEPGMYENSLLPCCGHFIIPSERSGDLLIVQGCNMGLEWKITHTKRGINLQSETGKPILVNKDEFQEEIRNMIVTIEEFYANAKPKTYYDDFEAEGWSQFWAEWEALKEMNGIRMNL